MIKLWFLGLLSYAALAQQGHFLELTQEDDHAFSVTWENNATAYRNVYRVMEYPSELSVALNNGTPLFTENIPAPSSLLDGGLAANSRSFIIPTRDTPVYVGVWLQSFSKVTVEGSTTEALIVETRPTLSSVVFIPPTPVVTFSFPLEAVVSVNDLLLEAVIHNASEISEYYQGPVAFHLEVFKEGQMVSSSTNPTGTFSFRTERGDLTVALAYSHQGTRVTQEEYPVTSLEVDKRQVFPRFSTRGVYRSVMGFPREATDTFVEISLYPTQFSLGGPRTVILRVPAGEPGDLFLVQGGDLFNDQAGTLFIQGGAEGASSAYGYRTQARLKLYSSSTSNSSWQTGFYMDRYAMLDQGVSLLRDSRTPSTGLFDGMWLWIVNYGAQDLNLFPRANQTAYRDLGITLGAGKSTLVHLVSSTTAACPTCPHVGQSQGWHEFVLSSLETSDASSVVLDGDYHEFVYGGIEILNAEVTIQGAF